MGERSIAAPGVRQTIVREVPAAVAASKSAAAPVVKDSYRPDSDNVTDSTKRTRHAGKTCPLEEY
jgi:hypothetical protein